MKTETTTTAAPSGLDAIKAEALAESGGAAASSAPTMGAPLDREAKLAAEGRAWAELPRAFGSVICMGLPELREAYSEANCETWGAAMAKVAERHGWTAEVLGPWLGLVFATLPMALPTVLAVKARRAARPDGSGGAGSGAAADTAAADDASSRKVKPVG